jgi:nicotinamide-nucleotide amidase
MGGIRDPCGSILHQGDRGSGKDKRPSGEGGYKLKDDFDELVRVCNSKRISLATAESCTGGFIASRITDVPGSSGCFKGGIVAYSNNIKMDLLGVDRRTLDVHGAVSRETAMEMARGLKKLLDPDISLSVTGIAGPSGGSDEKPVGTVFIGICAGDKEHAEGFHLGGLDRSSFKNEVSVIASGLMLGHADVL